MQNHGLEKRGLSGVFKTPKRIQFQQYHGIQNHKVCCTQTLYGTLKPKYFTKPWYFSQTPKILCIQTGPNWVVECESIDIIFQLRMHTICLTVSQNLSNSILIHPIERDGSSPFWFVEYQLLKLQKQLK